MLRKFSAAVLILGILFVIGCSTHVHKVGNGAQGNDMNDMIEARQWYVLFGLVPLNEVDTNVMAGGATDYEIKTQANLIDVVIGVFTAAVSVSSRTVTVRK
jgi:hypothetical protein